MNLWRSVIIAKLERPEVARPGNFVSNFCFFFKTTPYSKIFKILFRKFSSPHRATMLCSNVVKICTTRNRWNRALFTWPKKHTISAASQTVATARIAPKICQGQPPTMCSQCYASLRANDKYPMLKNTKCVYVFSHIYCQRQNRCVCAFVQNKTWRVFVTKPIVGT